MMHYDDETLTNDEKRLRWYRPLLDCDEYVVQPYGHIIQLEHSDYINGATPIIESPFDADELSQLCSYFTSCLESENILTGESCISSLTWDYPRYLAGMVEYLFYGITWNNHCDPRIDDAVDIAKVWHDYSNYDPRIAESLCSRYKTTQQSIIECYHSLKKFRRVVLKRRALRNNDNVTGVPQ